MTPVVDETRSGTSFGVPCRVSWTADAPIGHLLDDSLPPDWSDAEPQAQPLPFAVSRHGDLWQLDSPDDGREVFVSAGDLMHALERRIGAAVALRAPGLVFIHAGVVDTPAGVIMLPGRSFAGKTTLTGALLEAGCGYMSDEYAVLTSEGLVLAYPRRLSFRVDGARVDRRAEAPVPTEARPVAAVLTLRYAAQVEALSLEPMTPGQMVMHMFDNAIAAQPRGREVLAACAAVAKSSRGWQGTRGEAGAVASEIVSLLLGPGEPRDRFTNSSREKLPRDRGRLGSSE